MDTLPKTTGRTVTTALAACVVSLAVAAPSARAAPALPATRVPVVFSGGHETDPQDRGRPVVLIANALGVPPEVFRDTFRRVRPAPAGEAPDPEQVRRNKDELLAGLSRYGVTNERLDAVSNYYRYDRRSGRLWPTQPATAYALVRGGKVVGFAVTNGGAGYSSPPIVTVPGFPGGSAVGKLSFGKQFQTNGSVAGILERGTRG